MLSDLVNFILAFDEVDLENETPEIQSFRFSLLLIHNSDIGYLYSTAVFHWKYLWSDFILNKTGYGLNTDFIKNEILWCAENERFDCITKFLIDGYYPNLDDITKINTYFIRNNYHHTEPDLFQQLNHIQSLRRLESIVNNMRNRT